jgi:hypothetical protein
MICGATAIPRSLQSVHHVQIGLKASVAIRVTSTIYHRADDASLDPRAIGWSDLQPGPSPAGCKLKLHALGLHELSRFARHPMR